MPGITPAVADMAWPSEAEVCALMAPRIRAYGRRYLASNAAAEDLVQDVLTLIIEALRAARIAAPAALPAYALSVARNLVRDRIRTSSRRSALIGALEVSVSEVQLPAWQVEARDVARVGRCLERLSDREREVVVRSYLEEEDSERIAASLGIEPGNLRVIRHRAIARLRTLLEESQSVERERTP
jgi:RNA polymerase sigma-70 factor (ECF subfamily)